MNDIAPIGQPRAASLNRRSNTSPTQAHPTATSSLREADSVELSSTAQLLSRLKNLPEVRNELIKRVKAEIADGTYLTPDKIGASIDNLADDLG